MPVYVAELVSIELIHMNICSAVFAVPRVRGHFNTERICLSEHQAGKFSEKGNTGQQLSLQGRRFSPGTARVRVRRCSTAEHVQATRPRSERDEA